MSAGRIPLIMKGEPREGSGQTLRWPTRSGDHTAELAALSPGDVAGPHDTDALHSLPTSQLIEFYSRVAHLWANPEYAFRRAALAVAQHSTGYDPTMLNHAYDAMAAMLSAENLAQMMESELGDTECLDAWVNRGGYRVHAQPRGVVLHVLAGNAPPIGPLGMVRGSLTKNVNLVKVAEGDPATSIYFALSFRDVDPDHPITSTTSVLYWEPDSDTEAAALAEADAICVWGGAQAVEAIRAKAPAHAGLIEFGPRRSLALIGREVLASDGALTEAAAGLAHEMALYDQEACHSPQIAFVEGDAEAFCEAMASALADVNQALPNGFVPREKHAQISHERLMVQFRGEKLYASKGTEWTVVLAEGAASARRHPLGRTLYVVPVTELSAALAEVDESVQTIGVCPESRAEDLRERATLRGADRLVPLGQMSNFPPGYPQEGCYPLSRLVRWVYSA